MRENLKNLMVYWKVVKFLKKSNEKFEKVRKFEGIQISVID